MSEQMQYGEVTLRLTVEEIDQILALLGKQVYEDVYTLIHKIQIQGRLDLQEQERRAQQSLEQQ